jgi:hypothetical protein
VCFCISNTEKPPEPGTASICSSSDLIGIDQTLLSGTSSKNTTTDMIVSTRLTIRIPLLAPEFARFAVYFSAQYFPIKGSSREHVAIDVDTNRLTAVSAVD